MSTTADDIAVEVNYDELIPNNVDLANDAQLKKALERWQPKYVEWWNEAGPEDTKDLEDTRRSWRCATSLPRTGSAANTGRLALPSPSIPPLAAPPPLGVRAPHTRLRRPPGCLRPTGADRGQPGARSERSLWSATMDLR